MHVWVFLSPVRDTLTQSSVSQIPAQQAYTVEKIEPSAFSSAAIVDDLLHEMESMFAARFGALFSSILGRYSYCARILARGDKKRAMQRLRSGGNYTSHHFSTFRTGMALGLAVPALADGIYQSTYNGSRREWPFT